MLDLQQEDAIKVLIAAFLTIKLKPIAEKIQKESGVKVQNRPIFVVAQIPGKQHFMISCFLHLLN